MPFFTPKIKFGYARVSDEKKIKREQLLDL